MHLYRIFLLLLIAGFNNSLWAATNAGAIEPAMIIIPAGEFLMGEDQPLTPGNSGIGEHPKHKVTIKRFALAQHEVTVKQFAEFIKATGYKTNDICWKQENNDWGIALHAGSWDTPAYAPSSFHPVMCVSWDAAQAYLQWLSQQTGKKYRLPSESEWEYAARAGSTSAYYSGEHTGDLCSYGNIMDRIGKLAMARDFNIKRTTPDCSDMAEYTSVVGMYQANTFGLYDMIGNVSEMVEDCQHPNYIGAPADGSAWTSSCEILMGMGSMKIARGGSYNSDEVRFRSAARSHTGQTNQSSLGEGFRIAMDIDESAAGACNKPAMDCRASAASNKLLTSLAKAQKTERSRRAKSVTQP